MGNKNLTAVLYEYARKNLLWLNVYVKDSFATRIVRDERMTRTSFVANVGGLLGLCMGFSLVSVAEILYFGCKRQPPWDTLCNRLRFRLRQKEKDEEELKKKNEELRLQQQQQQQEQRNETATLTCE